MKYVKKYQSGGGLVAYTPNPLSSPSNPAAPQSAGASGSSEDTKNSFKPDKLFDIIVKSKGLTNETDQLIEEFKNVQHIFSYSDEQGWPYYMEIARKLNGLRRNEEMWESAYSTAKDSQGLNEVAVGTQGELYTLDKKGKIQTMSAKQYKQSGGVQLLTVADLLNQRDKNPDLIGNNVIFDVANTSVGMEKISKHIQDFVKEIGKDKTKDENFVSKTQSAAEIARALGTSPPSTAELKGLETLYKVLNAPTEVTKVTQEMDTQKRDMDRAARYIWQNLDTSAQNKLRAQAELNGTNPTQMLLDIIDGSTDHSESLTMSSITDPKESKDGKGSGGDSLTGAKHMDPIQTLLKGTYAYDSGRFMFNDPEQKSLFDSVMFGSMALTKPNGDPLGPLDLYSVMKTGWERVGKMGEMYFGNHKLTVDELNQVVTDGRSEIAHVILPVQGDGSPDNEALAEFNEVMQEYRDNKESMDNYQIKELFRNSGFDVALNDDGSLNVTSSSTRTSTRPFLLTWGYTTAASDILKDNKESENGGARKLSRSESSSFSKIVDEAWLKKDKNGRIISEKPTFFLNLGDNRIYKAPIYIALQDSYVAKGDQTVDKGPVQQRYEDRTLMSRTQNSGMEQRSFLDASVNDAN